MFYEGSLASQVRPHLRLEDDGWRMLLEMDTSTPRIRIVASRSQTVPDSGPDPESLISDAYKAVKN